MADQSMREIFARLERVEGLEAEVTTQREELATLRAKVTTYERTRRRPRRRPRWTGRLGAALVLALLLTTVPAAILATDRFPDVPAANPHHDDIAQIAAAGITIGFPDGTYRPDGLVTRGQMASFLARTAGLGGRTPVVHAATAQTAQALNAGGATAGQVLTANGSGGAAFTDLPTGTGGAGPAGPAGPPGTTGPQGPAGPPNPNADTLDGYDAAALVRSAYAVNETHSPLVGYFRLTRTTEIVAATIVAPVPGFLLVDARANLNIVGTRIVYCGVDVDNTSTVPLSRSERSHGTFDRVDLGTHPVERYVSCQVAPRFAVAPGTHTVRLKAFDDGGADGHAHAEGGAVRILFVPFGAEGGAATP